MANKKITDLVYYPSTAIQPTDLTFITDIAHQETKNTTATDLVNYFNAVSGSAYRTGSYSGSFIGTSSWANNLNYPNTSTASYSITTSYVQGVNVDGPVPSSSYSTTASYSLNSNTNVNFSETITQTAHGFSIGDALYQQGNGSNRVFGKARSIYGNDTNGYFSLYNEVVGVVAATSSANIFTVVYGGIVNFNSNLPPYWNSLGQNGNAYYLSGSNGSLSTADPYVTDTTSISKPVLLKLDSTRALVINQRGVYENYGAQASSISASYALTASYALNGGGSGSISSSQYVYYDSTPVGTIIAWASNSTPPVGYLLCDGTYQLVSGAYSLLATAIYISYASNPNAQFGLRYNVQTDGTYVQNDGGAYFKLPDLRGQFIRGYNSGGTNSSGVSSSYDSGSRTFGSLQSGSVESHQHYMGTTDSTAGTGADFTEEFIRDYNTGNGIFPSSSFYGGTETRPVNIALNYYIKYTQSWLNNSTVASIAGGTYGGITIGGDVNANSFNNTVVVGLQGTPVAVTPPTSGSTLRYNGSQWTPSLSTSNSSVSSSYAATASYVPNVSFGASTLSSNGYTVLPNGLILQWGNATSPFASPTSFATVTFPTPFPNSCFNIQATYTSATLTAVQYYPINVSNISNTGFMCTMKASSPFYWYAIGN